MLPTQMSKTAENIAFSIYVNMKRKLQFGLIIKMPLQKLSFVWWMLLKGAVMCIGKCSRQRATHEIDDKTKAVNDKDTEDTL